MKKLLSVLLSVLIAVFPLSGALSASFIQKLQDFSARKIVTVDIPHLISSDSSFDFISRYAYLLASLGYDQPLTFVWDYHEMGLDSHAEDLGYSKVVCIDNSRIMYDAGGYVQCYEIDFYTSTDTEAARMDSSIRAMRAIQCLEYGSDDVANTLISSYGETLLSALVPLFSAFVSSISDGTYATKAFRTGDFMYIVDMLPIYDDAQRLKYNQYGIYVFNVE